MSLKRNFTLILIIILWINAYSQNNDTVFIKNNNLQKIYINEDKESNYYNLINNFDDFFLTKELDIEDLESKWLKIYKYKNNYVLYYPCDGAYDFKAVINQKKIQYKRTEVTSYDIINIKRKRGNVIIKYFISSDHKMNVLKIKPIDKKIGLYSFEVKGKNKEKFMMIESSQYKKFNILINECNSEKQEEINFNN